MTRTSEVQDMLDACRRADAQRVADGTQDEFLNRQGIPTRTWQEERSERQRLLQRRRIRRGGFNY
jgi:hypothetical protein